MTADSRGYYFALGLSPGASIEVVRVVYRQLAKECHPDRPGCRDGGERFRNITEAYEALSDAAFKAAYDHEAEARIEEPVGRQADSQPQIKPVQCQVCDAVTAQPRRLVFWRVTSFLFGSHKHPVCNIYCSDCAAGEQWKSVLWTSLLGWWGIPWGPAWSIMYGVSNSTGGTREAEIDEALLHQNALAFAMRGDGPLAVGLSNILRKSDNADMAQISAEIIQFFSARGVDPATTLKDVWKRSFLRTAALFLTAFAVPAAAAAFGFASIGSSPRAAAESSPTSSVDAEFNEAFGPTAEASASVPKSEASQLEAPLAEPPCEALPTNGEVLVDHRTGGGPGHKLEIDNGTRGDAIIKIRNASSNRALATFFVERGQAASLNNIPDGEYRVQYAVGDKLASDCRSFVNDGSSSASEFPGSESLQTRYEDDLEGTRIIRSRLSYTLYSVPNGNVRPSSIDMSDFNRP